MTRFGERTDIIEGYKKFAFRYLMLNVRGNSSAISEHYDLNPWFTRLAIRDMEREGVVEATHEWPLTISNGRFVRTPTEYQLTGRQLARYLA
ncbi:MAG TPA: hypothetical protein VJC07_01460 [Candidatus Nanoarchaeia archaeon]|nr:hypothetical protein [Candidatus Nanoarchaeia archaeon]